MTARLLKSSVAILMLALAFSFPAAAKNWNQSSTEVTNMALRDGTKIPPKSIPNDRTAEHFLSKYLYKSGYLKTADASDTPMKLTGPKTMSSVVREEMKNSSLLSYLLYDKGKVILDELTTKFSGRVNNDTKLYSFSMGKTMVSYLLGHAICDGYIDGVDQVIDDWPLINNTLYNNQRIIDIVNMSAGDQEYIDLKHRLKKSNTISSDLTLAEIFSTELKNSKKGQVKYNYSGLPPKLILNYIVFKSGNKFNDLLSNAFTKSTMVGDKVSFRGMAKYSPIYSGSLNPSAIATRYDFLRIAISILEHWKNDTCVGKYLKEIYNKRVRKKTEVPNHSRSAFDFWRGYGGFFHTDYITMKGRTIMGMDGYGGQMIWIDFDKSRIVYVHTVHHGHDWQKIVARVIKGEEDIYEFLDIKVIDEGPVIIGKYRTTKYDRTLAGMTVRFKCLADYAVANDITDLPANQEIESLIANLEGNDYYRSHRQIVKAGISKEAMDTNKAALVRLVNFEGTNDEYCAKPVLHQASKSKLAGYSDMQVCAIAKTTNGLWNNQYEDERVWVREAKLRGLDCIDSKAFEAVATSSSNKKVCDKATAKHGNARKWLADLKSDEAIFHIWRTEAERRGLSCNVIND